MTALQTKSTAFQGQVEGFLCAGGTLGFQGVRAGRAAARLQRARSRRSGGTLAETGAVASAGTATGTGAGPRHPDLPEPRTGQRKLGLQTRLPKSCLLRLRWLSSCR